MSQKFLTNIIPVSTDSFVASGASHAPGFVPDPGATAGTTKFLREDATWSVPSGGTAAAGGSSGSVQYNNAGSLGGFGSWDGTTFSLTGNAQVSSAFKVPTPSAVTTFSIAAENSDPALAANVLKISNSSNTGSMILSNTGVAIFQGTETFFGFADRALGFADTSAGWGMFADGGAFNIFNESTYKAELSVSTGGLWAIESTAYGTYIAAAPPPAKLYIHPTANATTIALAVRGATSQSVSLQEWQGSTGTVLASVTAAGVFTGNGSGLSSIAESQVTGLVSDLAAKSPIASPTFTGTATTPHLACNTSAPTAASSTGAGNGSPTVTVTGNDHAGTLAVTTGASPTASATVMTVTFNVTFGTAPKAVILTPANAATAAIAVASKPYVSAISTSTFTVTSNGTALTASTAYKWYYHVL